MSDIVRPMIAEVHQAPINPKITLLLSPSFQSPPGTILTPTILACSPSEPGADGRFL